MILLTYDEITMIIDNTKKCSVCKIVKDISNFWKCKSFKDGLYYDCIDCKKNSRKEWLSLSKNKTTIKESRRKWYKKTREERNICKLKYYYKNREKYSILNKNIYDNLKIEIFNAYGNKCDCCGENKREFFSIDHVNGGGCQHRKNLTTKSIYTLIKKEGFPKDKYRILCYNCNMSIGFLGYCPHNPLKINKVTSGRKIYYKKQEIFS